jgi:circadian clock protein KaiC
MNAEQTGRPRLECLPTGITGLDMILRGGFLRGGVSIVQGPPGAGKTVLGNQICFRHAANGDRALYVTLLAETHARMLLHMGQLSFFDEKAIPTVSTTSAHFGCLRKRACRRCWIYCAARSKGTKPAC